MYEVYLPRTNEGTWFPTKTSAYRFIRQSDQPWLLSRVDGTYTQATVVAVCGLLTDWEEILPEYANAVTGHHQDETVMIFDNAGDVISFRVNLASRTFVKDLFYELLSIETVVRQGERISEFLDAESVRKSMYNILNTLDRGTWVFRYPWPVSSFNNICEVFKGYATVSQYDDHCWQVSVH
jgi:hypothetical protein